MGCMSVSFGPFGRFARASAENGDWERVALPANVRESRVLIIGGAGVAGRNTAVALSKFCPHLQIIIGGRNRDKGARVVSTLGGNSEFAHVDIQDFKSLESSMTDVDVVVHAAGPFEYADSKVLEAAIQSKTAYIDICDHAGYARQAKSNYMNKAIAAGVPAITNAGVNPGVSNLMAATLIDKSQRESKGQPERLRYNYFTAGSGGAGPGVLATSFYLIADEAVTYKNGEKINLKPYSNMLNIDFGKGIGKKDVFLMNVPEVASAHEIFKVPTINARFGTAPFFWNWTLSAFIKTMPVKLLKNKNIVQVLVKISYPLIRAVDIFSGKKAAIRVDLQCSGGYNSSAIFSHERLSEAAGTATAAFVLAVLEGSTMPGVWYPEEPEGIAIEARETLLRRASQGAMDFQITTKRKVNKEIEGRNIWNELRRRVF
ncbi:hypothetical protein CASFOL_003016 [Castilleja foliolosa]|uniref:Saccharopine dehydrogenase NADP binding domain-containing protein n=1 Tax=Castilleja foliolosa TaxID=1961234 RepID=A0ABD3EJN0_9LAMI